MSKVLVTVYVTCRNYGQFAKQALESLACQTFRDFEVLFIDDASSDASVAIGESFGAKDSRFRVIQNEEQRGLQYCANLALREARGKYIIRLDADDWFDPNALLVMTHFLESHEDVALVFPNYYYVDQEGGYLGLERRRQLGVESNLLDLPAHGACTMVRKRVLKSVGGYDEVHKAQDGYELWLKIARSHKVASIETPLFYYRQHSSSLSTNESRILTARSAIKRAKVERMEAGPVKPRVVAIIPAKNSYSQIPNVVLRGLSKKPLIQHTLDTAVEADCFDHIFVTTDDPQVVSYCEQMEGIEARLRPSILSNVDRRLAEVVHDAVLYLEDVGVHPDIVCVLSVHCPLRTVEDIHHAIDTLKVFDSDSVVSVYEDLDLHLKYGKFGLETLNPGAWRQLRLEREALFAFNGALTVCWRDCVGEDDFHGQRVSHVTMPRDRSVQIKRESDFRMIESLLELKEKE